jgi:FHS family glucose/mannose:H+ symporter-like MFS transporter
MFLYFGYVGIEVSINAWMVTHLTSVIQMKTEIAQLILSAFWLGILIFRLLNTFLLNKMPSNKLLVMQWTLVTLITFLLVLARSIIISCVLIIALSVFMAGISPTNAENAKEYISGNSALSGILFASGGLGGTILPIIIGQASTVFGAQCIYVCIAGSSIIMFLMAVLNYRTDFPLSQLKLNKHTA